MTMALSDYHLYSIIGLRPDVVFPAFSLSRFSSLFQRVFPGPAGRRAQLGARRRSTRPPPKQSAPGSALRHHRATEDIQDHRIRLEHMA